MVGYSSTTGGQTNAFRWTSDGGMENLSPGSAEARAFDVNGSEHVVGRSNGQAYRWISGAGLVLLDDVNLGAANCVNNTGVVIGERTLVGTNETVLWNAQNTPVIPFSGLDSQGVALNEFNQYVGKTGGGAGGYYFDGVSGSGLSLIPTDLNNARQIVGSVSGIAAVLNFDSSETTLLGKLAPTDTVSRALGINQAGMIVGISEGTGAFLFDFSIGSLQNLTSLLTSEHDGWKILAAEDINNHGWIVGAGSYNGGPNHAVILVPQPFADLDFDGDVDGRDFLAWQRGKSPHPFSAEDLAAWQELYGSDASSPGTAVSVVPEPSALALLIVFALRISFCRVPLGSDLGRCQRLR